MATTTFSRFLDCYAILDRVLKLSKGLVAANDASSPPFTGELPKHLKFLFSKVISISFSGDLGPNQ